MTVKELIERLQDFDPDSQVAFSYNSGDYWHTVVAETVDSVEEEEVTYSDYHNQYKVVSQEEDDEEFSDEQKTELVVLLVGSKYRI